MSIANDRMYAMPTHRLRLLVKKNSVPIEDVTKFAFDNHIGFQEAHKFLENYKGPVLQQWFIVPNGSGVWFDVETVVEPNPRSN